MVHQCCSISYVELWLLAINDILTSSIPGSYSRNESCAVSQSKLFLTRLQMTTLENLMKKPHTPNQKRQSTNYSPGTSKTHRTEIKRSKQSEIYVWLQTDKNISQHYTVQNNTNSLIYVIMCMLSCTQSIRHLLVSGVLFYHLFTSVI